MGKKPIYSLEEAMRVVRQLGITSRDEYRWRYSEDPKLHKAPNQAYPEDWECIGKWRGYLGINDFYHTWAEAAKAARVRAIVTAESYASRYKRDPRLPARPDVVYRHVWKRNGSWPGFLGTTFYPTYRRAHAAVMRLGILSIDEYKWRYRIDPRLPSTPAYAYPESWKKLGGWPGFLGLPNRRTLDYVEQAKWRMIIAEHNQRVARFPELMLYRKDTDDVPY